MQRARGQSGAEKNSHNRERPRSQITISFYETFGQKEGIMQKGVYCCGV